MANYISIMLPPCVLVFVVVCIILIGVALCSPSQRATKRLVVEYEPNLSSGATASSSSGSSAMAAVGSY